ncbi:MAG: energy transducer TonB [Candidatus Eisenbacteria bacterium]|uniref:Energy transducer TonB n=1 Tax=Eiseniibacteriota bacterium TaxID=2212470 RepID=A0A933SDY7_UNCEI|nr:energy transducer TonB [Candidatus Eisenbacteria bacterium]
MSKFTWSLVLLVSLLATVAFAEEKPVPPLPQFGKWSIVERPGEKIHLQRLDGGWLSIHRGNTTLGRAGREKDAYLGVVREQADGAGRVWFVRITAIANNTLRAEIRDGWDAANARVETWVPESGDTALFAGLLTPASASDGERDPAFGEYVYVEELPEALYKVAPSYPEDARRANVDGTVMVQVLIGKDGHVKDMRVTKSIPMLDDAAMRAVRQWTFVPATSKGKPVAVWVAVPVKFSLH